MQRDREHPERFVKGPPQPADLPTAVWIPPAKKSTAQDAPRTTIVTSDDLQVDPRLQADSRFGEAVEIGEKALALAEKLFGPDDVDTARSLSNLARLYEVLAVTAKAEPLHLRALAIWEKSLGPGHVDTVTALSHLALMYSRQGAYAKAEPLLVRVLAAREQAQGQEHPDTAFSLNNLATLYFRQGEYGKAEPVMSHYSAEPVLAVDSPP